MLKLKLYLYLKMAELHHHVVSPMCEFYDKKITRIGQNDDFFFIHTMTVLLRISSERTSSFILGKLFNFCTLRRFTVIKISLNVFVLKM